MGTREYHCIKLKQHIPKRIYQFGRYLRVRYDDQPEDQQQQQQNLPNITEPTDDTPDIQEQETKDTQDIQEQETDDTPEIQQQEQETSQQKTQPQTREETQETRQFKFYKFIRRSTPPTQIKKTQSLEQISTDTEKKAQNIELSQKHQQTSLSKESLIWWPTPR